jgi:hypothetical protein
MFPKRYFVGTKSVLPIWLKDMHDLKFGEDEEQFVVE